jgi:hypothetical protein
LKMPYAMVVPLSGLRLRLLRLLLVSSKVFLAVREQVLWGSACGHGNDLYDGFG